jgi:hypothetical protein
MQRDLLGTALLRPVLPPRTEWSRAVSAVGWLPGGRYYHIPLTLRRGVTINLAVMRNTMHLSMMLDIACFYRTHRGKTHRVPLAPLFWLKTFDATAATCTIMSWSDEPRG